MYFITSSLIDLSKKFTYLSTFNIEVAHRCSDNRGHTVHMYRCYTAICHFNGLLNSLLMHMHTYVLAFNDTQ